MKTAPAILCTILIGCLAPGCLGYRMGTSLPGNVRSIYIPTFVNKTDEPLLETEATRETIQAFQTDGSLRIAEANRADCRLEIALTALLLEPVVYERNDAKVPEEYRLRIKADVTLLNSRTGEKILTKQATGERLFAPGGDLATAKRNAIPPASRDLARKVVKTVVAFW
jgi:hypothetical protein